MKKPAAFSDKCIGKTLKSATHVRDDSGDMIVLEFVSAGERSVRMTVSAEGPIRTSARAVAPTPPRPRRL